MGIIQNCSFQLIPGFVMQSHMSLLFLTCLLCHLYIIVVFNICSFVTTGWQVLKRYRMVLELMFFNWNCWTFLNLSWALIPLFAVFCACKIMPYLSWVIQSVSCFPAVCSSNSWQRTMSSDPCCNDYHWNQSLESDLIVRFSLLTDVSELPFVYVCVCVCVNPSKWAPVNHKAIAWNGCISKMSSTPKQLFIT